MSLAHGRGGALLCLSPPQPGESRPDAAGATAAAASPAAPPGRARHVTTIHCWHLLMRIAANYTSACCSRLRPPPPPAESSEPAGCYALLLQGGASHWTSAISIHNEICRTRPDLAEVGAPAAATNLPARRASGRLGGQCRCLPCRRRPTLPGRCQPIVSCPDAFFHSLRPLLSFPYL